ncbi:MAG: BMP family ABC transporter substrate-binding protein [Defluviitaleaceae bacterium]|nr:BMP family ABC transporter substrate-binding protein [Defluviitaleaceae bacterium]
MNTLTKNFTKALSISAFAIFLTACGGGTDAPPSGQQPNQQVEAPSNDQTPNETEAGLLNIALIAHSPDSILDDGSFNEGAWQGIQLFAQNNPVGNATFFQPHTASDAARIDLMADAINAGANVLVLPGFHFESSLYEAQDLFPEVNMILLDASPRGASGVRIEDNVIAIHYAEHEAGFLAGYAAVMEGYRYLGFMGGIAVPPVVRFGHGFVQGAEHAAASLGLSEGDVVIRYHYIGQFAPDPAITTTASAWYESGVEAIFVAAGGAGFSVFAAAEATGGSTIGVDVDQVNDSSTVVVSAIKGLNVSVYEMLDQIFHGTFAGGREMIFDAAVNGIGLTMQSSRMNNFTMEQYNNIFEELANGNVVVNSTLNMDDIITTLVSLNEV